MQHWVSHRQGTATPRRPEARRLSATAPYGLYDVSSPVPAGDTDCRPRLSAGKAGKPHGLSESVS